MELKTSCLEVDAQADVMAADFMRYKRCFKYLFNTSAIFLAQQPSYIFVGFCFTCTFLDKEIYKSKQKHFLHPRNSV